MGRWIISLLLVALGVRALVPAGFMPSSERPFSFQICPDGFPAELLQRPLAAHAGQHDPGAAHAHHHLGQQAGAADSGTAPHHRDAARSEHCVFAAAASAGPAPEGFLLGAAPEAQAPPRVDFSTPLPSQQRFHIPQSRAPPIFS